MRSYIGVWFPFALVALGAVGCGSAVEFDRVDGGARDAAPDAAPRAVASCASVRASCGGSSRQFVRGHAEGLTGLEGARVLFSVPYRERAVDRLGALHGGLVAAGEVRDGAFEACLCLPTGGSGYPVVAAVVFTPGTSGETSRAVARATVSGRYVVSADEELSGELTQTPSAVEIAQAIAATVDRPEQLQLTGLGAGLEGASVFAGLISDEAPVASQVDEQRIAAGAASLRWTVPGRAWPSERVAVVIDRNHNRSCDPSDVAAVLPREGRQTIDVPASAWVQGAALREACASLQVQAGREF